MNLIEKMDTGNSLTGACGIGVYMLGNAWTPKWKLQYRRSG